MKKLDLDFDNNGKPRSKEDLQRLLDSARRNDANLAREEQDSLIDEIQCKINGCRFTKQEVLKQIEEGQADISDLIGT